MYLFENQHYSQTAWLYWLTYTTSKFPGQFEHFVNYLEMEFSIATNVVKDNFIHIIV